MAGFIGAASQASQLLGLGKDVPQSDAVLNMKDSEVHASSLWKGEGESNIKNVRQASASGAAIALLTAVPQNCKMPSRLERLLIVENFIAGQNSNWCWIRSWGQAR